MPPKAKRWSRFQNTLAGFIQALEQTRVVLELRADTIVRGRIESVDEYLNVFLSDVTVQDLQDNKREFEHLYLRGKTIRYIHLPRALDPAAVLQQHRKRVAEARRKNALEMLNRHVASAKGVDAFQPQDDRPPRGDRAGEVGGSGPSDASRMQD